jgi:hypothetical protein
MVTLGRRLEVLAFLQTLSGPERGGGTSPPQVPLRRAARRRTLCSVSRHPYEACYLGCAESGLFVPHWPGWSAALNAVTHSPPPPGPPPRLGGIFDELAAEPHCVAGLRRGAQPTEASADSRSVKTVVNLRSFNSDRDELGDTGLARGDHSQAGT